MRKKIDTRQDREDLRTSVVLVLGAILFAGSLCTCGEFIKGRANKMSSQLVQKIQAESPLITPTPAIFKDANGATGPIYPHREADGQIYFSLDPTMGTSVTEKCNYRGR